MTNPNSSPSPLHAPSKTTTTIPPLTTHTHTLIFLHGREDYGPDLATSLLDSTSSLHPTHTLRTLFPSIKWIFPTAVLRYCAKRDEEVKNSSCAKVLKGEEVISQWFDVWDLKSPEERSKIMREGLGESVGQIKEIIEDDGREVGKENVVLGGISQGCATAFYTLLSLDTEIGGFIGVSSWFPFRKEIEGNLGKCEDDNGFEIKRSVRDLLGLEIVGDKSYNSSTMSCYRRTLLDGHCGGLEGSIPVFLSHSKDDETVPFSCGQGLREKLGMIMTNSPVTWKEYEDGGHWIHPQHGVDDISTFLNRSIGIPSPILGEGGQDASRIASPIEVPNQEPRQNVYEETCARLEEMSKRIESWDAEEQTRIAMERRTLENGSYPLEPHVASPRKEPRKIGYEEMCERLAKEELEEIARSKGDKAREVFS